MTSLLPPTSATRDRVASNSADTGTADTGSAGGSTTHSAADIGRYLAARWPMSLLAALAGVIAAGSTLLVCMAGGVVGWFLTDAGSHGTPSGGLRVGALSWLAGHGSGVMIQGVEITAAPLGLTLLCAWVIWRVGHRLGDAISGHGPDAAAVADGERDWTVPVAVGLLGVGYIVTAVLASSLAATEETAPSTGGVIVWSIALCLLVGGPAIAIGSGRAAIWTAHVPHPARVAGQLCRRILVTWCAVSALILLISLIADFGTAVNVMSQLHTDGGAVALILVISLAVLPNAIGFSGAYALGPGFTVGAGTVVSPSAVALGPLPMFPMLAALPDTGTPPGWVAGLVAVPLLLAGYCAARVQRAHPTLRWDIALARAAAGGVLAGGVFGVFAALVGGAVGPGRMQVVGPDGFDVLVHAVTAFGLGSLIGAAAMTWWQRRDLLSEADADLTEDAPTA